ncbi:MAG: 16S rRNA (guanine(527)-N(7))-methyltransferase RsmG [Tenericutes bacterium]|nr:16S rRNA (guanine(527)-N(7))-methyltransferase RsmG [Mycoplasmatota bacterium]
MIVFTKRDYLDEKINEMLLDIRFSKYYEHLITENKITNLTRIVDEDSVYYKHFYDSLILSKYIDLTNKKFLDVGAGAGFPSIPLKIMNDSIELTIIDSLNKRIKFLAGLADILKLTNCYLIHGRAEELDKKQYFDIVTSRAVARLNMLAELTIPFVKLGGYFVAFKSINYQEELMEAMSAIEELGGELERVEEYNISDSETRVLLFIKKIKTTKKVYPRQFFKIKKRPL